MFYIRRSRKQVKKMLLHKRLLDSVTRAYKSIAALALLFCCILLYAGCGHTQLQPSLPAERATFQPATTSEPEEPTAMFQATPAETTTLQPATTSELEEPAAMFQTTSAPMGLYHNTGPISSEKKIVWSHLVARVRLRSVIGAVEYGPAAAGSERNMHNATLELSFQVLEYLKGSGASEIVAVVKDEIGYDTEAEARALLPDITASRDTRWDDREAIVFLRDDFEQPGRYFLGFLTLFGNDAYTVSSPYHKEWLPAALPASDASVRSGDGEQRFLLDDPSSGSTAGASGRSTASGGAPTIALDEIKTRITDLGKEVNAGDGSEEYMRCVLEKHTQERQIRWQIENMGSAVRRYDDNIGSGLPAGTVLYEDRIGSGFLPDKTGRYWLEGSDKDLFDVGAFDLVPYTFAGNGPPDSIRYSRRISTARPLPAGEYQYYFNGMWAGRLICEAYSELERNLYHSYVHVTAPDGVFHEALFDPGAAGDAVGFSSAAGSLEPAGFTVGRAATNIESLLWQDGSVVLTLAPYAALTGYGLDFIELDGSVGLSLTAADAVTNETAGTLTWSAADQPWQDGDQLMLRIREVRQTAAPTPTPAPTPGTVWSAAMTVGASGGYLGYGEGYGDGTLTRARFTWQGTEYTVEVILHNPYSPNVSIDFTAPLPQDAVDALTLHLGDSQLNLAEARGSNRQLFWYAVELDWTEGDSVPVRLTE